MYSCVREFETNKNCFSRRYNKNLLRNSWVSSTNSLDDLLEKLEFSLRNLRASIKINSIVYKRYCEIPTGRETSEFLKFSVGRSITVLENEWSIITLKSRVIKINLGNLYPAEKEDIAHVICIIWCSFIKLLNLRTFNVIIINFCHIGLALILIKYLNKLFSVMLNQILMKIFWKLFFDCKNWNVDSLNFFFLVLIIFI